MNTKNKKRTNKKLLIGLGATLAAASGATALGVIVSQVNKEQNNSNIFNSNTVPFSVTNDGYPISSNGTALFANENSSITSSLKVNSISPNNYKAVPNGYIIPMNDYLVCVDKNDLRKVLWYDQFTGWNISSVEYMPKNDKLVVLLTKSDQIRVCRYGSVSTKKDGGKNTDYAHQNIFNFTYGGDNYRHDTWKMVPVVFEKSASSEVYIFPGAHNQGSDQWAKKGFIYDVDNNSFLKYHKLGLI